MPQAIWKLPIIALSILVGVSSLMIVSACGGDDDETLTIYSGRSRELVQPILDRFEEETGFTVEVRYGDTAEMAATILEEGNNSPADVFYGQDAGALGALREEGRLTEISSELLERVPSAFRSPDGTWVGTSGRARVVVYNTSATGPDELPSSVYDFTDPEWQGRIGWAPTNGSFQAFVTAMRIIDSEDTAREWLEGMVANGAREYPNNTSIVDAAGRGEIDAGLVNHYYLYRFLEEEGEGFGARNHYLAGGDPGTLVNIAGLGIVNTTDDKDLAERFVDFMLSQEAQQYFADETYEYPLIEGIEIHPDLVPLAELEPPDIDLSDIADLQGTLDLLRDTGVLP